MQKNPDPQPAVLPFAPAAWKPRRLRPVTGRIAQTVDLLVLSAAYLGIVLLPSFLRARENIGTMLQLNVTLRVVLVAVLCVSTWRVILFSIGLYTPQRTRSFSDYLLRCVIGLNSCALVVGLIEVVLHAPADIWHVVACFWLVSLAGMGSMRALLLLRAGQRRPRLHRQRTLIVVGSGPRAREVYTQLEEHAEWDYRLLGFVDSEPQGGFVPAGMILGGIDDLKSILTRTAVDEVHDRAAHEEPV